jgi:cytochrome c
MKRLVVVWSAVGIALMGWVLGAGIAGVAGQEDASKPEFYMTRVQPIFQTNCYRCHAGFNRRGGFNIQTRAGMLKGGHDGAVLVPGDPEKSLLVRLIRHEGPASDPMPMPSKSAKLSDADIATVERWVKAGAIMPADVPKP